MRILLLAIILMTGSVAACGQFKDYVSREIPTPTPAAYFDGTITLELVAPSEVREHERVTGLDVIMTNTGQEPFTFIYSGDLLDFEAYDDKGEIIWFFLGGGPEPAPTYTLLPGESKALSEMYLAMQGQWDLRDYWGFPLEPGKYQIKGIVTLHNEEPSQCGPSEQRLETSAHTLKITKAPLPEFARGIEVELTAPSETRAGEPVPMDMRITNKGSGPVILWWSGDNMHPGLNFMDMVMFGEDKSTGNAKTPHGIYSEGRPIWNAKTAHSIEYYGTIPLGPGESLDMSDMDFSSRLDSYESSGEPWVWNQTAYCDEDPRLELCQKLVTPGTYTVRGVVNVSTPEALEQEAPYPLFTPGIIAIATEPQKLVIRPSEVSPSREQFKNYASFETPTPTPASYFDGTITLELVADSEAREIGPLIVLDVIMTNKSQKAITFYHSGYFLDFEAVDAKGQTIWHHLSSGVEQSGGRITLPPGWYITLSKMHSAVRGRWDLRDQWGFPVGPGKYQVKGIVTLSLQDQSCGGGEERLETSARTLKVTKPSLPEYARGIELELTAPSEARAGEPVSMDMRITNKGSRPVTLWWSGDYVYPRPNYIDIVIFREGKPVWRATSAHGVEFEGKLTLGPGESLAMSNMPFSNGFGSYKSSGEPWEWDQRADCDESSSIFEPCDKPVEPGTYTVRGVVNISLDETSEPIAIATEPQELMIRP